MRRGLAQSHRGTEPDRLEGILVEALGEWALMSCAQTDRRHTPCSLAPRASHPLLSFPSLCGSVALCETSGSRPDISASPHRRAA